MQVQVAQSSSQRARIELGPAVTNEAAQRAAREAADTSTGQHKQSALAVGGDGLSIDTADREAVRLFYNRLYVQPEVPIQWTGSYETGNAGTISTAYQASAIKRINWYRAMAGLPAATTLSTDTSAGAQQAALMMSANGQLSHFPPSTWTYYTAAGAKSAGLSNLSLGAYGPAAIDAYINDFGSNNAPVGHRRWIFHPQSRSFGIGDVPRGQMGGKDVWGANATTVTDVDPNAPRKARDEYVAWPPRGYVPHQVVYGRWSLSHTTADFSQAKVAVSLAGAPLAVTIEPVTNGYGENTIVWQIPSMPLTMGRHTVPAADLRYHVTVSNVIIAGQARAFDYDVTVFDPAVQAAGVAQPQVSVPVSLARGAAYTAQVSPMPNATAYGLLVYQIKQLGLLASSQYTTATWTAGDGISSGAIGSSGLLLYQAGNGESTVQTLTLNRRLAVGAGGGVLSFMRSAGYAMPSQIFRVQVSTDDGASWTEVYSETGRGLEPILASRLSVPLAKYAGRAIRLRFAEDYTTSAYIGPGTGWSISDVGFENVGEMVDEQDLRSADGNFSLTASQPGNFMILPRVQYKNQYFSDAGPAAFLTVDGAVLHGARSSYTITRSNDTLVIRDNTGQDGVQIVRAAGRLDFTDVSLAFDTEGNAGKGYRLYRAAFDRKPDNVGLGFWIAGLDGGLSLEAMADGFVKSAEFAQLYGAAPGNKEIITALYRNVLHRVPDEGGAAFWLNNMAAGMTVPQLLIAFSESKENKDQVAPETQLGIAFTRK
jgi:uncharacterized protein YkwD